VNLQTPLPQAVAWRAVARCAATSAVLLAHRRVHLPRRNRGMRLRFADGSESIVYRETAVDVPRPEAPCVLVVEFRLRAVRGWGHALFRWESLFNTPLFVGFPGLVSKLWLVADEHGVYRGLYEWDGPERAESYARSLWRVLALVSVPGSIHYRVVPGVDRQELLSTADLLASEPGAAADWWRPVAVA
jgi:hypothetical protein